MCFCCLKMIPRHAPKPTSKTRNADMHRLNGNSSKSPNTRQNINRSNKQRSLSNLKLSKNRKKAAFGNLNDAGQSTPYVKKRRRSKENIDPEWSPKPTPKRVNFNASGRATAATQTTENTFRNYQQIQKSALLSLQREGKFSDKQMRVMMRFHRRESGLRTMYAANCESMLTTSHQVLSNFFTCGTIDVPDSEPVPIVYCSDTLGLLRQLESYNERNIRIVHHSVDAGKEMTKWSFSLEFEPRDGTAPPTNEHGRHNAMILAILPGSFEGSSTLHTVYSLLKLPTQAFYFSFHADFKALCAAVGVAGGSATCPCPYCDRKLAASVPLATQATKGVNRTCTSVRRLYKKSLRATKIKPGQFANCVCDPLSIFPQTIPVLDFAPLPELHLWLVLNWFIKKIVACHPAAESWYLHYHQLPNEYHGGQFNGPQLHRLTRDNSLEYLDGLLKSADADATLFYDAMCHLVKLQHKCFGLVLHEYEQEHRRFRTAVLRLPITKLPLKIHVILAHLKDGSVYI